MIFRYGGKATVRQGYSTSSSGFMQAQSLALSSEFIYAETLSRKGLWIRLYNKNGDLQLALENKVNLKWEYNRKGGCGQAEITLLSNDDRLIDNIQPESKIEIYIDRQLRYSGKLIRVSRNYGSGNENISLVFFGYLIELSTLIVTASYEGMAIGTIVKDILDNYVVPYSNISYNLADIDDTDYAVSSVVFNHTVSDAMSLLADLGGNIEWGVDRNRKFFFKETDPTIRRVYFFGKEVSSYQEERQDDGIINVLNVFGGSDNSLLTTISSDLSVAKYGRKTANLFESSIDTVADASRLGVVNLKNTSGVKRSSKFSMLKNDEFIESSVPIGATTVNKPRVSISTKYGHHAKYGRNIKYGKLRRDQISTIVYQLINGGFSIEVNMSGDVPNMGDFQKRIENEIKNIQRR